MHSSMGCMAGKKGKKNRLPIKDPKESVPAETKTGSVEDLQTIPESSKSVQPSVQNHPERISGILAAVFISIGFTLVLPTLISAAQVAGVISMGLAHLLVIIAWFIGIASSGVWIFSVPRKHSFKKWVAITLIMGLVMFGFDRWMVWKKANQEQPALQPTFEAQISTTDESPPLYTMPVPTPPPSRASKKQNQKTELQRRKEEALRLLHSQEGK